MDCKIISFLEIYKSIIYRSGLETIFSRHALRYTLLHLPAGLVFAGIGTFLWLWKIWIVDYQLGCRRIHPGLGNRMVKSNVYHRYSVDVVQLLLDIRSEDFANVRRRTARSR